MSRPTDIYLKKTDQVEVIVEREYQYFAYNSAVHDFTAEDGVVGGMVSVVGWVKSMEIIQDPTSSLPSDMLQVRLSLGGPGNRQSQALTWLSYTDPPPPNQ